MIPAIEEKHSEISLGCLFKSSISEAGGWCWEKPGFIVPSGDLGIVLSSGLDNIQPTTIVTRHQYEGNIPLLNVVKACVK